MSSQARRVCVIGSGGREHALARLLARSADVVVTPGNPAIPGQSSEGHAMSVSPAPATEIDAELFVIGPEAPLVDGLADQLRAQGKRVVGPGADGAALEGSKAFMKDVLAVAGVPTARYGNFDDVAAALAFLDQMAPPYVIKTDGLAAGKGVLVTDDLAEARRDVESKLSGARFGAAGRRIVIEEGLIGIECSLLVLCDGKRVVPLAPAQDFKRRDDADGGPNTGGMGAFSPIAQLAGSEIDDVVAGAVEPLVAELRRRAIDYRGILYAGLMLTDDGPKVLEYNVRLGDPEAQVLLTLFEGDAVDVLGQVADGHLHSAPTFSRDGAVCVVMASPGYPEAPVTGSLINGLGPDGQMASALDGVTVFHAGTAAGPAPGTFATAGGRVLGVTGRGADLGTARQLAYEAVAQISFEGAQFRSDIALHAAQMQHSSAR